MPSLCCFWCPASATDERSPGDPCPSCGRPYDTPLKAAPESIGSFRVLKPISRGFYGATFRAEQASLGRVVVLKVVPTRMYEHFRKDWARECQDHADIARGTPFVASITDQFDEGVTFGGETLDCHIAVLENIPGPTLEQVLADSDGHPLTARGAAQVAADLFEILRLFNDRGRYHNDLHAGNVIIRTLTQQELRSNAIDAYVRAVAIDLGSVKEEGRSGGAYYGDQHHVSRHLGRLARAVHVGAEQPGSDVDFRIAEAIRGLAEHLSAPPDATRIMTVEDASVALQGAIRAADEPWRQPLRLQRFGGAYNAQALESWHVPELWFDPDGRWLAKTSARGPQVVTGMRGCGKTMLLRALHFHARAASARNGAGPEDRMTVLERLRNDPFVGLFASCQKLLNPQDRGQDRDHPVDRPFERLYVAYLRDALQVLRHARSLDPAAVVGGLPQVLRPALDALDLSEDVPPVDNEQEFDRYLLEMQFALSEGSSDYRLRDAPAAAFGHLGSVIRAAAPLFAGKYVLFLLDDVSTRYLPPEMVRKVISMLLFQHTDCAFRITTEAQALQRVLLSPGGSAPADPLRDYELFDLGNEVYRLLQERSAKDRTNLVSEILRRRGTQFADPLYRLDPAKVLGEVSLESIAREIGTTARTSAQRKRVYRGLRALQAACVGDLGDVVKLYERILERAAGSGPPVSDEVQCDCFLEHSAGLVHFLNRRDQNGKKLALAFAQAAGDLLLRSARGKSGRLRQYTKLYVRVDTGPDSEAVSNGLLDLLDAGVFVYDGGAPRTKTRDDDPVLQFKLSYRKMLGLASYIGLADRDRFELSGEDLRRWLDHPEEAKDILLANQVRGEDLDLSPERTTESNDEENSSEEDAGKAGDPEPEQGQLEFDAAGEPAKPQPRLAPPLNLEVATARLADWSGGVDALVLGLGFEERTIASVERLLEAVVPSRVILVRYSEDQGHEILSLARGRELDHTIVDAPEELRTAVGRGSGSVIVDTTGLSKPFIFAAVREAVLHRGRVRVVHTLARDYYPRNDDIEELGIGSRGPVSAEELEKVTELLMGESGPYRLELVHSEPGAPDRSRALLASSSPKNDRLLHLLDERIFDATRIFVPPPTSPRRKVARAAAELATSAADVNTGVIEVDTNDMGAALAAAEAAYSEIYHERGANVEVGLTGSKMHTVALASLAAVARVANAWYVAPQSYDRRRFTEGVGDTHAFEIRRSTS